MHEGNHLLAHVNVFLKVVGPKINFFISCCPICGEMLPST